MNQNEKRVLIIDDSPDDIHFVMENLQGEYNVVVAISGVKGIALALKAPQPNVILLDVMMPGINGYETCKQLKENPLTQNIDVIFISAYDTVQEKMAGYDAGGSDYLIKPVQSVELLQKVKLAISNTDQRIKDIRDKDYAFNTAMSSAAEQEVVIGFLRNSFSVRSIEDLAKLIVEAIQEYNLLSTVQISSVNRTIYVGNEKQVRPIEKEILLRSAGKEKIKEFKQRTILSRGGVTIFIKNMPRGDKRGRLSDNIVILLEGAATKLVALRQEGKLAEIASNTNGVLVETEEVDGTTEADGNLQDIHDNEHTKK
ncbi:MAG: DNA-binding response OmpR family regulator [Alteromonadaceae bacterium]|jgi:DNA-binding response OmpR family regulator